MALAKATLAFILALVLGARSMGDPYGHQHVDVDNALLWSKLAIPGVSADGAKISGT